MICLGARVGVLGRWPPDLPALLLSRSITTRTASVSGRLPPFVQRPRPARLGFQSRHVFLRRSLPPRRQPSDASLGPSVFSLREGLPISRFLLLLDAVSLGFIRVVCALMFNHFCPLHTISIVPLLHTHCPHGGNNAGSCDIITSVPGETLNHPLRDLCDNFSRGEMDESRACALNSTMSSVCPVWLKQLALLPAGQVGLLPSSPREYCIIRSSRSRQPAGCGRNRFMWVCFLPITAQYCVTY